MSISIIIPIYNTELYLNDCLNSVLNQTFHPSEIILINDGSTDSSQDIISDFSSNNNYNIKVHRQKNSGLSNARNKGISMATGDYLLFLDSDDMIVPTTLELLHKQVLKTNADIIIGNALYYYDDENQIPCYNRPENLKIVDQISGVNCFVQLMESESFPPMVPLYFVKRNFIIKNNLYFQNDILHEDELWSVRTIFKATIVSLIDFDYYLYRQRIGSIMNSNNKSLRVESLFIISKELNNLAYELMRENMLIDNYIGYIYVKIFTFYHSICCLSTSKNPCLSEIISFYSDLLLKIYNSLNYRQQLDCLNLYRTATMILSSTKN